MNPESSNPPIPIRKRIFDFALTIPLLILISPVLLILAVLVRIIHGKPIIFRQMRPGYMGKPFYVFKFRTMTEQTDDQGSLLSDTYRLTKLGQFLRSYSLDELPELLNILKGEMSLVGPRPLLMRYLDRYTQEQNRRHHVLPGITGWAQINGRNAISWEEKFILDVWYVENWSCLLDLKILLLTAWKVIRREGINQPGRVTSDEFLGSNPDEMG